MTPQLEYTITDHDEREYLCAWQDAWMAPEAIYTTEDIPPEYEYKITNLRGFGPLGNDLLKWYDHTQLAFLASEIHNAGWAPAAWVEIYNLHLPKHWWRDFQGCFLSAEVFKETYPNLAAVDTLVYKNIIYVFQRNSGN